MKYETYKQMTDEQKEEWNYKFKDQLPKAPFQSWIMTSAILWLVFGTVILSYVIAVTSTEPELVKLKPMLEQAMDKFASGINLFTTVFAFYLIMWIIKAFYHVYSERKWLQQNGIQTKLKE